MSVKLSEGIRLVRITIIDDRQTISFISEEDTVLRLVAGCTINPSSLDELLIATDIYQRGLAAVVMADLIAFDKLLDRHGFGFIHQQISQARDENQPFEMAFQVVDDITEEEATKPRKCDLLLIDLVTRTIRATQDLDIPSAGEVHIRIGDVETERRVSYILPKDWEIGVL